MTHKIIFLDLDGTIINHQDHTIPKSTLEAIKKAQSKGHMIVIATGRSPSLFDGVEKTLGIFTYIAANGRYVKHNENVLYQNSIDKKTVKNLRCDAKKMGIDLAYITSDEYFIIEQKTKLPNYFSEYFDLNTPTQVSDIHLEKDVLQMVLFDPSDYWKKLQKRYDTLEFNPSCIYGVDINAQGGMKDIGVKVICDYFKVSPAEVIAIGDGYNDISMINLAGVGVAMGNACEPLKAVADMVTRSVDDDGIYTAFKRLNII